MWVIISGVQYFSGDTWTDVKAMTWAAATAYTWGELLNPHDSKVLVSPEPTVRDIVEDRSTADFALLDESHTYAFEKGEYVEILDFGLEPIFCGFIETATQTRISPDGIVMHEISCSDNHYLADKRLIAKGFDKATYPTVADCVRYIVTTVLDDEDITEGQITATNAIEAITFDYIPVSQALDELAEYAGCTWYIDFDRKLYFVPRSTYSSAWNITEVGNVMEDVLNSTFRKTSSNPEYRNYQYIRGGNARTALQTEVYVGDGETTSFPVGYKIAEEPTISVSTDSGKTYTAKDVGIKGVETGKDWYWSANDQIITQDFTGTRLTSTDRLKIEYYGLYQVVITSADFVAISDRITKEGGGSGLVERVKDDPLVTSDDQGLAEANAILDHYATIGTKVEYTTIRSGIEVGTLQHITSPIHSLDDDFLITQVEKVARFHDDAMVLNDLVEYRITGVSGPVEDYWSKVFLKLNQGTGAGSLASSTSVVLILQQFTHTWTALDSPNIWTSAVPDGSFTVSSTSFPGYDEDEGPTYISFWTTTGSDVEVFRKYLTSQTYVAGDKYVTTWYITSGEANLHWDEIRMYGGDGATSSFGTGTYLYTIPDSDYTKSALEALQIVVTDEHW